MEKGMSVWNIQGVSIAGTHLKKVLTWTLKIMSGHNGRY